MENIRSNMIIAPTLVASLIKCKRNFSKKLRESENTDMLKGDNNLS